MSKPSYQERFHISVRDALVRLRNLLADMEQPPDLEAPAWTGRADLGDVTAQLKRTSEAPSPPAVARLIVVVDSFLRSMPGHR